MNKGIALLLAMATLALLVIPADLFYTSRFVPRFKEIEKQRIVTSNQLATAKIVSENLNHVRDLVFDNMEFPGQKDSLTQEAILFEFLTSCVNDLKMKLISVVPTRPVSSDRLITTAYEIRLEGDFFSFGELCSKFENSRRVMALTSFEVTQAEHGGPAAETAAPKGGKAAPAPAARRAVSIRLNLETYRVKKG